MGDHNDQHLRAKIDVRGTREGLVVRLPDGPSPLELVQDVQDDIERLGSFFQRGELTIDYGTRQPDLDEIQAFRVVFEMRGIRIRTVTAGTEAFRSLLQTWGYQQPRQRANR